MRYPYIFCHFQIYFRILFFYIFVAENDELMNTVNEPILNDLQGVTLDTKIVESFSIGYKWAKHGLGDINPSEVQMKEAVGNVKDGIIKGMELKNNPNQEQGKGVGLIDP